LKHSNTTNGDCFIASSCVEKQSFATPIESMAAKQTVVHCVNKYNARVYYSVDAMGYIYKTFMSINIGAPQPLLVKVRL
jgi:hypothetical protein